MPYSPRPTLLRTWPAVAAAIATFAGMTSCIATVMPLSIFGAPLAGAGIAALLFSFLLALTPAARDEREQRDRIHFAAAIAWIVSVATSWRFARAMRGGTDEASRMYNGGIGQITVSGGVIVGIAVAMIVVRIGMAQYRRQAMTPGDGTVAQRMGIEHLLTRTPADDPSRLDRRRERVSAVLTIASVAALGYLGHLLSTYWMMSGQAADSQRLHRVAILAGMVLGAVLGEVLARSRRRSAAAHAP